MPEKNLMLPTRNQTQKTVSANCRERVIL